jgi:hypothetical protein
MAYTEKSRERSHAAKKLFMNGLLAVIIAGGIFVFVVSTNNAPAEQDLASQELSLPDFNAQPLTSPPDQPLPAPSIPPMPLPKVAARAEAPAPAPVQPVTPAPIDPLPVDPMLP